MILSMDDRINIVKSVVENGFSMPFDISIESRNGEDHYLCSPQNDDNTFFIIDAYIKNQIRIKCSILPQTHAAKMVHEMGEASDEKRDLFFSYISMLRNLGARVKFLVNDSLLDADHWPEDWRTFSCNISKVPLTDDNDWAEEVEIISEWLKHAINLILALLTVKEVTPYDISVVGEPVLGKPEGTPYIVLSKRYERNPVNRELCLHMKGHTCLICGFNFLEKYGSIGKKFIEVHHIRPVSTYEPGYVLNIEKDLIPVCPNCHRMLHTQTPPLNPKAIEEALRASVKNVLMAITYPNNLEKNISTGHIAFGIKACELDKIQFHHLEYILLHNWQNENSHLYRITELPVLVTQDKIPEQYFIRYKNDAEMFILLSFDNSNDLFNINSNDILHLQPKDNSKRYDLRFVPISKLNR